MPRNPVEFYGLHGRLLPFIPHPDDRSRGIPRNVGSHFPTYTTSVTPPDVSESHYSRGVNIFKHPVEEKNLYNCQDLNYNSVLLCTERVELQEREI